MYIYIYIHIYTYISIHIYKYVSYYIHTYMYIYIYIHIYTCIYIYIYTDYTTSLSPLFSAEIKFQSWQLSAVGFAWLTA